MKDWIKLSKDIFNEYTGTFSNLSENQVNNLEIKKEHSIRVAEISSGLAKSLKLNDEDINLAFVIALFHDIGRFKQLVEFDTFDDSKSLDHAEYSVKVLVENEILQKIGCQSDDVVYAAIESHNKFEIPKKLSEHEALHAKLLRDADKLDILKVLSDYYSNRNAKPNHTLTWDLPKGVSISAGVFREVSAGKLVSKKEVASEMDVKIMQLSWVFDINFKPSYDYLLRNRYLEKIYNSLPKNDRIIEIYRKVKVHAENKLLE